MIDVPGATAEEIAAITAVLASQSQEATPGNPPRMSPWKRAGRQPELDITALRNAGDRLVL